MKLKTYCITHLILLFLMLASLGIVHADDTPIIGNPEDATWEIYTSTTTVLCMILSDDGETLWVGTTGGLEQRDAKTGERLRLFTNLDGLLDNYVTALLSDGNGGIYIGTYFGLAHLSSDGEWRFYNTDNSSMPYNYVFALLSDGSDGIYIGTALRLAHLSSDGEWTVYDEDHFSVSRLLSDGRGGIYIGTWGSGVIHRGSNGEWTVYNENNTSLPDNDVTALQSDGSGGIYIGTSGGLTHLSSDGEWTVYDTANSSMPNNIVNALLSDGSGGIYIGTSGGLAHRSSNGEWTVYNIDNSSWHHHYVLSLFSDGSDGIYIGTNGGGLIHLSLDGEWTVYNTEYSSMPDNNVETLLSDGNGGIYISTWGGLTHRTSDGSWTVYDTANSSMPNNIVEALLSDGSGGIYIGTNGGGLAHQSSDGEWTIYNTDNSSMPDNNIYALLSDGSGGIYIGTNGGGLAHLSSDGEWTVYNTDNSSMPDNDVFALLSDGNGGIYIGIGDLNGRGGLAHLSSDGKWTVYDTNNSGLPHNDVKALLSDGNGGIYIGTDSEYYGEGGLAHLSSDGGWTVYNTDNSDMPSNDVEALLSDGSGGIYIGTYRGLVRLSFGQKNELYSEYQDETIIEGTRAAIIIAAGSSSPRKNTFWYATEHLTSQIIYSLFYNRGYDHSELYYLSPKSWANFNADGIGDHIVDAPVTSVQFGDGVKERDLTRDDIQNAFDWAKSKGSLTQPLYLYFVDHGAPGELMLTTVDALKGEALATMIDDYQKATGNQVVVILEACYSGSLIPYLSAPNRVIITSSSEDETSIYDQNGTISFSAAFCMNISGANLKDAFDYTKEIMKYDFGFTDVTPLLDDNGDGVADDLDGEFLANQIGVNGTWGEEDASIAIQPVNGSGMVATGSPMTFEAQTHAVGKIKKVWGVVRSPNPQVEYDDLGTPIMRNPTFNLDDLDGDGVYTGTFNEFTCAGDYTISFFAKDYLNNTAVSSAITITAQGGEACAPIEPNPVGTAATTEVHASQAVYHQGDTIQVQVKNSGSGFYDQYTAWAYPDGTLQFITEENIFVDDIRPWVSTPQMDNVPVTVVKLPMVFQMPQGTYWVYNLLVPAGTPDILQNLDEWLLTSTSFSVE